MTTFKTIAIDQITPHPKNVRRDDTPDAELIASIESQGILQPLGVVEADGTHLLIAGHRRYLAAQKAGLTEVPAIVLDHLTTEAQQIAAMLVENGRRVDLTPVEEGSAYEQLTLLGVPEKEIAAKTGRSAKTVKQRLALVQLPDKAREALHDHQITIGQAESLLELEAHPDLRDEALKLMGSDNFDFIVRSRVNTAERLDKEAALRAEYAAMGLPEVKQPKGGWDYQKGPRAAREGETPDAWFAGGKENWNSAPQLIVTTVAGSEKTAEQLKADEQWEKRQAKEKKDAEAAQLARRMRLEHVAELAGGLKVPAPLMAHLRTGVARLVADLTAGELDMLTEISDSGIERAKNDYHNDQVASQVLKLSNAQILTLFGLVLGYRATGNLSMGYKPGESQLTTAATYWDAFDASKYDMPKIDQAARRDLKKRLTQAITDDSAGA